jgi:hypothetical protein
MVSNKMEILVGVEESCVAQTTEQKLRKNQKKIALVTLEEDSS